MASSMSLNIKLISLVESATCIQDLTPLLNIVLGLTEIKDIVKQRLSVMNIPQKRDLYLKAAPMDELLPRHIVQYMIGFNEDLRQTALVNKTFHKCCQSAQRLLLRQQQTDWQKEFTHLHSDFSNNRITNIYPSSHFNTLAFAIQHAKSGDTLLIHQGVYAFKQDYEVNKNIKCIGYDSNVIIKGFNPDYYARAPTASLFSGQCMYFQNITFEMGHNFWMSVEREDCSFYMENCVIRSNGLTLGIITAETVKIRNCVFKGEVVTAISLYLMLKNSLVFWK
eukprot:884295_1